MVQASVLGVLLVISMAAASDGVEADEWEEFILSERTITLIESELAEAFGGLWLNEEPRRPRVMVGVAGGNTDRAVARIQAHLGKDGRDLAFVPVDYSWQELRENQDRVSHLVSSVSLLDSSLVSIDSRANRVRVELSRRDASKVLPVLEVLPR